jgi:hypothetical protein
MDIFIDYFWLYFVADKIGCYALISLKPLDASSITWKTILAARKTRLHKPCITWLQVAEKRLLWLG